MQVIGICRFSYPAVGGFQVEHASSEERAEYLYAPKRLASRFATFEAFTLPSIKAQTDQDFAFLIVIGDDLPADAEAKLRALVADIPQVILQKHPPGPHRKTLRDAINSVRKPDTAPCLQFRLDDDDAVSIHYIAKLRALAERARPLLADQRHIALDFNQGYVIAPHPTGCNATLVRINYWTPALAIMLAPRSKQSVMSFSHHRVAKIMPTVTMTGEDMFLRGFTEFNDSRQSGNERTFELSPVSPDLNATILSTFNVDLSLAARLFSDLP